MSKSISQVREIGIVLEKIKDKLNIKKNEEVRD